MNPNVYICLRGQNEGLAGPSPSPSPAWPMPTPIVPHVPASKRDRPHCTSKSLHWFLSEILPLDEQRSKLFTQQRFSHRYMLLAHHLYQIVGREFPHVKDRKTVTYTVLEKTRGDMNTLRRIVDGEGRHALLRACGVSSFRHKMHWRWLAARILVFLDARELAVCSQVCSRWDGLIFTTAKWTHRHSQTDSSSVSIFREVLRSGGLPSQRRVHLWLHELSPRVIGGHGRPTRSRMTDQGIRRIYAHAASALDLVVRRGSTQLNTPVKRGAEEGGGGTGAATALPMLSWEAAAALIDEDVRRTFGDELGADGGVPKEKRKAHLRNVLRCYVAHNNRVGYCQGMDYLTSFLLEHCEWNEAVAFSLLDMLMVERDLQGLFSVGLPFLRKSFYQFNVLLSMHMPNVSLLFEEEQVDVTMFATNWFMTLFTDYKLLSRDAVATVFDLFVVDGWSVIMGVALALLKSFEAHLLGRDMEGILNFFKQLSGPGGWADGGLNAKALLTEGLKFGVTDTLLESIGREFDLEMEGGEGAGKATEQGADAQPLASKPAVARPAPSTLLKETLKKPIVPSGGFFSWFSSTPRAKRTTRGKKEVQSNVFRSGSVFVPPSSVAHEDDGQVVPRVSTPF